MWLLLPLLLLLLLPAWLLFPEAVVGGGGGSRDSQSPPLLRFPEGAPWFWRLDCRRLTWTAAMAAICSCCCCCCSCALVGVALVVRFWLYRKEIGQTSLKYKGNIYLHWRVVGRMHQGLLLLLGLLWLLVRRLLGQRLGRAAGGLQGQVHGVEWQCSWVGRCQQWIHLMVVVQLRIQILD